MSIARAFTLRNKRTTDTPPPSPLPHGHGSTASFDRSNTVKRMGSVIDRMKISAPVELISTTNMLSYNAPDVATLRKLRQTSSTSSASSTSGNESDSSAAMRSSGELTDASSVEENSPITPEPNHLSCYFESAQNEEKKPRRSATTANLHRKTLSDTPAPAIPQRALSHSKSAHLQLARKRSIQTINSNHSASLSTSTSISRSSSFREQARSSLDLFKGNLEPNHPFGKELEKLNEVVEELGGAVRDAEYEEDVTIMKEKCLMKWSTEDYLHELRPLYIGVFGSSHSTEVTPAWI